MGARLVDRGPVALNEALVVTLDGAVDPLRLSDRSVTVRADDGRVLASRCRVKAGLLVVELVVDDAILGDAPSSLELTLAGLPSVHALSTLDGRWLVRTTRLVLGVGPRGLAPIGASGARLIAVAGHDVPPPSPMAHSGALTLVFDGVLDPGTLDAGACPLFPVERGLVLGERVEPRLRWRCIGRRFEIDLDLVGMRGRFELDLRQTRMRDLSGAAPQPALKTELALS